MGKVRKTKQSKVNKNVPVDNDVQEEEIPVDSKENALQTVLDQLQAGDVEEKYCGLQTLALLIEGPENIQNILKEEFVKVVAPLLLDAASSVRNSAAGLLRNLSIVAPMVCDFMMEQDVMTPLTCYFHERIESWNPDPNSKSNQEDIDTLVQCINLLMNLCESSELAIKYLGQTRILDILPRFLVYDDSTPDNDIVTAALQCLFVVVDDNPIAMEKIKSNSENQLQRLLSLEGSDPSLLLLKTLSAGVIINTCGGNIATLPVNVINQIISILATTLSIDHRLSCSQLSSNIPLANPAGKLPEFRGKEAEVLEKLLKSVSQMLDAQQSAVEIVANICSCEDGDNDDAIDSSESDEMEEESNQINCEQTVLVEDRLPIQVMEALTSLELFEKVWARTQEPAQNVLLILKEYEGSHLIYKKLRSLQTRALLCINNMLSALPIENLGGVNGVYKIWVEVGKLVFKQSSEDNNVSESATAVMRAAMDKIRFRENNTSDCNMFNGLALTDIEIMLTGIRNSGSPEIRSNLIRMIGLLALVLVNTLNDTTAAVICTITEFILEQALKEHEVWVLAEAIDTLVDLYSEDETDILAAKVKLVDKLAILSPILKNKARQQKKLPKDYRILVSTAVTNLPRFIQYKKSRVSKL